MEVLPVLARKSMKKEDRKISKSTLYIISICSFSLKLIRTAFGVSLLG